jgi:molecular chaperone DnaK
LVWQVEKDSKEWVDRLDESQKQRLDEAVESAKTALKSGESADISQALENLSQAYSAAGASLYEEAQAQSEGEEAGGEAGAAADAGEGNGDEDVVEADYEIVEEEKKVDEEKKEE